MIVTAHQSSYLPWLGLFHKVYLADIFVFFDSVQFSKKDFTSRNLIKTSNGLQWLTIPTFTKGLYSQKINEVRIENNFWQKKHFKSILSAYKNSQYLDYYYESLSNLYNKKYKFLVDVNYDFTKFFFESIGINTRYIYSSNFAWQGSKNELIINMCKELRATAYIFGQMGLLYADQRLFEDNTIKMYVQEYQHPIYSQLHGAFKPKLSVIDLLMNEGHNSLNVILSGNMLKLGSGES
jgi:hypothetical protein